jgi:hypothetical protein
MSYIVILMSFTAIFLSIGYDRTNVVDASQLDSAG